MTHNEIGLLVFGGMAAVISAVVYGVKTLIEYEQRKIEKEAAERRLLRAKAFADADADCKAWMEKEKQKTRFKVMVQIKQKGESKWIDTEPFGAGWVIRGIHSPIVCKSTSYEKAFAFAKAIVDGGCFVRRNELFPHSRINKAVIAEIDEESEGS